MAIENKVERQVDTLGLTHRLFRQSFRFAQGDHIKLQPEILKWIIASGYLDKENITPYSPEDILNITAPHQHNPSFGTSDDPMRGKMIINAWNVLATESANHRTNLQMYPKPHDILPSILEGMIKRDLYYQKNPRIRPNEGNIDTSLPEADSSRDPYASFLTRYALQGDSTRHPEYDTLFSQLGTLLRTDLQALNQGILNNSRLIALAEFRKLWSENHPNEQPF